MWRQCFYQGQSRSFCRAGNTGFYWCMALPDHRRKCGCWDNTCSNRDIRFWEDVSLGTEQLLRIWPAQMRRIGFIRSWMDMRFCAAVAVGFPWPDFRWERCSRCFWERCVRCIGLFRFPHRFFCGRKTACIFCRRGLRLLENMCRGIKSGCRIFRRIVMFVTIGCPCFPFMSCWRSSAV